MTNFINLFISEHQNCFELSACEFFISFCLFEREIKVLIYKVNHEMISMRYVITEVKSIYIIKGKILKIRLYCEK